MLLLLLSLVCCRRRRRRRRRRLLLHCQFRFGVFRFASGGWKRPQGILKFRKNEIEVCIKNWESSHFFIRIPCEMCDPCLIQLVPAITNPFCIC